MSPILSLIVGCAGVWLPMVVALVVSSAAESRGPLARRSLLASLVVGAVLILIPLAGGRAWVVEGIVEGRALVALAPLDRLVTAGVLLGGTAALAVQRHARLAEQARYAILVGSCAALPLCADLIALVAIAFLIVIVEAWFRRAHAPTAAESSGPLLIALGAGLIYGGLSTTSFAELSGRVSAVFTKWGGAMQFLGPLERDLPLPEGARTQFVGDVVTGAAPAMLTLIGMAVLLGGLLVAGRYVAAPASADRPRSGLGASTNALLRLAILGPFVDVFVRGFGALRLVSAPYGWPLMVVVVIGVGVLAVVTDRDRPRTTSLAAASMLMGGATLLVLTQTAVARPFELVSHAVGGGLESVAGFAVAGAVGVCIATISLETKPAGLGRPLSFALLGFAPPTAGAAALLGASSLGGSPLVSAAALGCAIGCWWLLPAVARETRPRSPLHWGIVLLLATMVVAPLAPPVARLLALG